MKSPSGGDFAHVEDHCLEASHLKKLGHHCKPQACGGKKLISFHFTGTKEERKQSSQLAVSPKKMQRCLLELSGEILKLSGKQSGGKNVRFVVGLTTGYFWNHYQFQFFTVFISRN